MLGVLIGGFCRSYVFKYFVLFCDLFNFNKIGVPPSPHVCGCFQLFQSQYLLIMALIMGINNAQIWPWAGSAKTIYFFSFQLRTSFLYITSTHWVLTWYKMGVSVCEYNVIGKMCSLYNDFVLGGVYFYHRFTLLTPLFLLGAYNF